MHIPTAAQLHFKSGNLVNSSLEEEPVRGKFSWTNQQTSRIHNLIYISKY